MLWSLLIIFLIGSAHMDENDMDNTAVCKKCCFRPNGTASQSSEYKEEARNFTADKAIDGQNETCAHTLKYPKSWWNIDLLGVYSISCVSIFNDKGSHTGLKNLQIRIGNSRENNGTDNNICRDNAQITQETWNDIHCNQSMLGRYIHMTIPDGFIILCEVKICGTRQESPFKLIKKKKTWEDALSYCRERHNGLASIHDQETQTWAELEARRSDTPYVWLALRYICIVELWYWVDNYRLEFNRWAPNKKTGDCDMSGAMDRNEDHLWFSMSDNKKFNFICAK